MRRTRQHVAAGLLVTLVLACLAQMSPAAAETGPAIEDQAWARTGVVGPIAPSDDHLYVSAVLGAEQSRTFIEIGPAGVAEEELARTVLELQETSDSEFSDSARLFACSLDAPLETSGELSGPPPEADCEILVPLERSAAGTWTVDLAPFASRLGTGEQYGLVLVPESDGTGTFSLAFDASASSVVTDEGEDGDSGLTASPSTVLEHDEEPPPGRSAVPVMPSPDVPALPSTAPASEEVSDADPSARPEPSEGAASERGELVSAAVPDASRPSAAVLLLAAPLVPLALWVRRRWLPPRSVRSAGVPRSAVTGVGFWGFGLAGLMLLDQAAAYKVGLIAIAFVSAIGLHILVNWAGELSLAHAAFVGMPAFMAAQVTTSMGISPIAAVPVGIATGLLLGLLVALAALRAQGMQVALVTLAIAIAFSQFFFHQSWIVGPPAGLRIDVPTLFGVQIRTTRSLLILLAVFGLLAVLASKSILASKIGRGFALVRSDPNVAAAVGVPVSTYRAAAYVIAGGFAGLGGAMYVLWVQLVTPEAFSLDRGFELLAMAVLAGKAGLAGLAVSAVILEGGKLFSIIPQGIALYAGPLGVIYVATRYQGGLNGALQETRIRIRRLRGSIMKGSTIQTPVATHSDAPTSGAATPVPLGVVVGGSFVVAGFLALALAWYHMGNTDQVWVQNQEMVSGGLGGLAMVMLGCAVLVRDALLRRPVEATPVVLIGEEPPSAIERPETWSGVADVEHAAVAEPANGNGVRTTRTPAEQLRAR